MKTQRLQSNNFRSSGMDKYHGNTHARTHSHTHTLRERVKVRVVCWQLLITLSIVCRRRRYRSCKPITLTTSLTHSQFILTVLNNIKYATHIFQITHNLSALYKHQEYYLQLNIILIKYSFKLILISSNRFDNRIQL